MRIQEIVEQLGSAWSGAGRVEDVGDFDSIEDVIGAHLPADYKFFLMWSNGGETLPPLRRCRFYPLEELLERRADGQPPDVLELATDDNDGYALDLLANRDAAKYPVIRYPLGDRERVAIERVSDDFSAFLASLIEPA